MYQPIFLLSDIAIINDRVGDELEKTSYAFNSLYQMGAPVSLSTDAPVEDCNPFENIYVLQRTPKFTYRPLFSANPKSHPPANQLLLD